MFSDSVSVLTSATSIRSSNTNRATISITNNGSYNVYLGGTSGVTVSNGMVLIPGDTFTQGDYNGDIYGIADTATCACAVYEVELS